MKTKLLQTLTQISNSSLEAAGKERDPAVAVRLYDRAALTDALIGDITNGVFDDDKSDGLGEENIPVD